MSEKFEALKKAVQEFSSIYGHEKGFNTIAELVADIDRMESAEKANPNLIDRDKWESMTYPERLELKRNQPDAYQKALEGNFKGGI